MGGEGGLPRVTPSRGDIRTEKVVGKFTNIVDFNEVGEVKKGARDTLQGVTLEQNE